MPPRKPATVCKPRTANWRPTASAIPRAFCCRRANRRGKAGGWRSRWRWTRQQQNYATVRLWGSDATADDLILFCEGKQVGYRHLGDIDLLDIGGGEAAFPGRFIYNTTPLPLAMTRGKTNLNFEIRSSGPIWGYGNTFDKFQKPMTAADARHLQILHAHGRLFRPARRRKTGRGAGKSAGAHDRRARKCWTNSRRA